jgi:RND superfamily putative drug exporter
MNFMMEKLGNIIVKRRWWVVGIWLVAAILIVSLAPSLTSIESNDQSSFIPKTYESVKAMDLAKKVSPQSNAASDIIVFQSKNNAKLTTSQKQLVASTINKLKNDKMSLVKTVITSSDEVSPNKKAQLATVIYRGDAQAKNTINEVKFVRQNLSSAIKGTSLKAGVTGTEAISYDTQSASNKALKIVSIGTILIVLFLPAFIFKSPLAGLLPLISVGIVYTLSSSLIAIAGHIFNFHLSQQLSILFTVVLFGIGTDYILFFLFRYRERLRTGDHTRAAVGFAISRAGEAIFSAALVVLSSFSALFFAKFGIFSSLAPGLVICVALMMIAALTLVPAIVAIIGEKVFWPSKAWMIANEKPTYSKRVGGVVSRRPGTVIGVIVIIFAVIASFSLGYKADFSSFSQPPKNTPSASTYTALNNAFPAGTLDPVQVFVSSNNKITQAQLKPMLSKLRKADDIANVQPAKILKSGKTAIITASTKTDPFSARSLTAVAGPIRTAAHSIDSSSTKVYVGGATSSIVDVSAVTNRDLKVIFPIAALFIFIILGLLLRSLVAPIFLLLCVSLGFLTTLGATTLIFKDIGSAAGVIFFIPVFLFIFVVAIGTDYNILTITRLREEVKEGNNPRRSAELTVEHSSATVASAGTILAATFASLTLGGISFLTQMGAAIAIGVALSAFVIAPFLIPSISALVGYKIWWPGHRPKEDKA